MFFFGIPLNCQRWNEYYIGVMLEIAKGYPAQGNIEWRNGRVFMFVPSVVTVRRTGWVSALNAVGGIHMVEELESRGGISVGSKAVRS